MIYRLYFLKSDGHIEHAMEFDRADDAEAMRFVEGLKDDGGKELWQKTRRIAAFAPRQPTQIRRQELKSRLAGRKARLSSAAGMALISKAARLAVSFR